MGSVCGSKSLPADNAAARPSSSSSSAASGDGTTGGQNLKKASGNKRYKRQELGIKYIASVADQIEHDVNIYVIHLRSVDISQAKSAGHFKGSADPFVEMRLKNAEPVVGDQLQRSSSRPNCDTLQPTWEPVERFQFICSRSSTNSVLMSVMNMHMHSATNAEPTPLADGFIALKTISK
jgi:C2 domain